MTSSSSPTWLALADGGPVADLLTIVGARTIQSTTDPIVFADLLRSVRPRVAIVVTPPADTADLELALDERRRRSSLRVVTITPSAAIATRLHALRAGVDEAHPDTIDPTELGARIALLEERARPRPTSILTISPDTELDLVAYEVRRAGALVHLRPKEFQLLSVLAAHPGRAYTRRQLLDRVWRAGHDGDPRTVDVHIRWLRSKIEPRPEAPIHLVTVRGVGYRLDRDAR
jgi:two-component system, OmpR family, alkaline phosphatase synthesis response regulator PhoP